MPSLQEQRRNQIVQFVERWKHHHADWRVMTAQHFIDQGMQRIEHSGSVARKRRWKKSLKNISPKREALRRAVNHKTSVSQQQLAIRFGCDQSNISGTIKRLRIMYRKRVNI